MDKHLLSHINHLESVKGKLALPQVHRISSNHFLVKSNSHLKAISEHLYTHTHTHTPQQDVPTAIYFRTSFHAYNALNRGIITSSSGCYSYCLVGGRGGNTKNEIQKKCNCNYLPLRRPLRCSSLHDPGFWMHTAQTPRCQSRWFSHAGNTIPSMREAPGLVWVAWFAAQTVPGGLWHFSNTAVQHSWVGET